MIDHVVLSAVAAPLVTALGARILADHASPRTAVVGLTVASCLTAVGSTVSLVVAGSPAAVAALRSVRQGELSAAAQREAIAATGPACWYALGALGVLAWFARIAVRQRVALRAAYAQAAALPAGHGGTSDDRPGHDDGGTDEGDDDVVVVVPDARPDAFALPGSPGRVVVTAGMLAALTADQRAALLAHERAHLSSRHHRYAVAARLASGIQPLLRPVTVVVEYSIERWADERAAADTGDRRSTARAIGTAALVGQAAPSPCVPAVLKAATGHRRGGRPGPIPRRVAALLRPPPSTRGQLPLVAIVLAVAGASLGLTVEAFFDVTYSPRRP